MTFVKGLSHGGIKLRNSKYSLLWMYDKKSGLVSEKKSYELIVSDFFPHPLENIILMVWKFNIPQKIKCFTLLAYNKKINTWDNLYKSGWIGPNRCSLCKSDAETIDHLFVDRSFMQEVLHSLDSFFNVQLVWLDLSLSGNLISWFSKDGDLLYLPIFVIWNL